MLDQGSDELNEKVIPALCKKESSNYIFLFIH